LNWQDDIRRLDEELAAGRISADEYRSRRDALLAQTAGTGAAMPPNAGPQMQQPPQQQWRSTAPNQQEGDRTQVVRGGQGGLGQGGPGQGGPGQGGPGQGGQGQGGSPEATQYIRPVDSGNSQDGGERTQVVSGIGGGPANQSGPIGPMPTNQGGWSQDQNAGTPWGGSSFPPLSGGRPNEPWYAQGPEVFDSGGGGKKGRIFAIVGVVVLIAVAVAAILVFKPFSGNSKNQQADGSTSQTTRSVPTTTPTPTGPLPQLQGTTIPNTVHTFTDVTALGFLTSDETKLIQTGSPADSHFANVYQGQTRILILIVKLDSASNASSIAHQLSVLETTYGMAASNSAPTGVELGSADPAGKSLRRAEYSSGSNLVRIEVQSPTASSADQVMSTVLQAQLEKLPADG
jgi:hypothetical protein